MLDLTVGENLFIGNYPRGKGLGGIDWKKLYERSDELLKTVGLSFSSRNIVRSLSTSQQQLLSIAKALVKKTQILAMSLRRKSLCAPNPLPRGRDCP